MGFARGISEVVLIVADVPRATAFYRDVVGLELERPADDEWAWFGTGSSSRLALHRGPLMFAEHSRLPEGHRFGPIHYAFRVERDDLDAAVAHVRRAGAEVYGPVSIAWMASVSYYFYDLDGNLLEWWSPD